MKIAERFHGRMLQHTRVSLDQIERLPTHWQEPDNCRPVDYNRKKRLQEMQQQEHFALSEKRERGPSDSPRRSLGGQSPPSMRAQHLFPEPGNLADIVLTPGPHHCGK